MLSDLFKALWRLSNRPEWQSKTTIAGFTQSTAMRADRTQRYCRLRDGDEAVGGAI
jgi:hypothetical protein